MLLLLPSLLQPLPLWDPLALVLELQLEMEPKTLPLPQALLRAPVLELARMFDFDSVGAQKLVPTSLPSKSLFLGV